MANDIKHGLFVWHDLMTANVAESADFDGKLFGWTTEELDMGEEGIYTMVLADKVPIGGMVKFEMDDVPPHWMPYVAVDDVETTVSKFEDEGGFVCMRPRDIPEVGRFSIVHCPQGGVLSTIKFTSKEKGAPFSEKAGHFCWCELLAKDSNAANEFYGKVFNWEREDIALENDTYWLQKIDGVPVAGVMNMPPGVEMERAAWVVFIAVDDVDEAAKKAQSLGATVQVRPTDIPNIGRFASMQDPQGAVFNVFKGV